MADNINVSQIQNIIGYTFKDETFLKKVFIHSSRSVYGEETNERLLFLGRRLFDVLVCDYIFSRSPYTKEKQLEAQFDEYRSGKLCDSYLKERNLTRFIQLSELAYELFDSPEVRREAFFALLGAIYRDGGMPSLKGFLLPLLRLSDGESVHASSDTRRERKSNSQNNNTDVKPSKTSSLSREKKEAPFKKDISQKPIVEAPVSEKKPEKHSFIRDALAPVRLPESMKTKPRHKDKPSPSKAEQSTTITDITSDDGENYKSKLQEFVQKNIRSASVLLKYKTYLSKNEGFTTEITLEDKLLAVGKDETKRLSERAAAKTAYEALMNTSSELYKEFRLLCQGEISVPERREDYISKLNQYYQRTEHESSAPISYERRYSTERKTFCVALLHNDEEITSATGPTLKDARQNAAKKALELLGLL